MNKAQLKGHAAVLTANTIFGLGVPVTALLLSHWVSPQAYMAIRCLGAAAIFWFISLFLPREPLPLRHWLIICLGGLLGVAVSQTLTAWALHFTTPVHFSLLATLTPVGVMLCAASFIGERITPRGTVGVLVGIVGALLLVWSSTSGPSAGRNDLLGLALALLSLLTWAIYLIITRSVSGRYGAVTQMKWVFLISAVALLPWSWSDLVAAPLFTAQCTWEAAAQMAFIVIFATVVGYFAIPYAMQHLQATTVSVYTNLQPIVASVVAIWWGQDVLTWDKPLALLLVMTSAWMVTKKD